MPLLYEHWVMICCKRLKNKQEKEWNLYERRKKNRRKNTKAKKKDDTWTNRKKEEKYNKDIYNNPVSFHMKKEKEGKRKNGRCRNC